MALRGGRTRSEATATATARVLAKVAAADGELADPEREFIRRTMETVRPVLSDIVIDALAREVHGVSVREVLAPFLDGPLVTREGLLRLCIRAALADREVMPEERKVLGVVHEALGLPGHVLDWIVEEAAR